MRGNGENEVFKYCLLDDNSLAESQGEVINENVTTRASLSS